MICEKAKYISPNKDKFSPNNPMSSQSELLFTFVVTSMVSFMTLLNYLRLEDPFLTQIISSLEIMSIEDTILYKLSVSCLR